MTENACSEASRKDICFQEMSLPEKFKLLSGLYCQRVAVVPEFAVQTRSNLNFSGRDISRCRLLKIIAKAWIASAGAQVLCHDRARWNIRNDQNCQTAEGA